MSSSGRRRSGAPRFALVICGLSASGKSALAAWAASFLGLPAVSPDLIRKELAQIKPSDRASPDSTAPHPVSASTLNSAAAAACVHAKGGVIVDATFRKRANREAFAGTFAGAAPVLFVECRAPLHVLLDRAEARERDSARVSDATAEIAARQHSQWEPLDEVPADHRIVVNTTAAAHLARRPSSRSRPWASLPSGSGPGSTLSSAR